VAPAPAAAGLAAPTTPTRAPEPVSTIIPVPPLTDPAASNPFLSSRRTAYPSTLTPELQREVEKVAQRQEDQRRKGPAPAPGAGALDQPSPIPGSPASTRLEISRAPSPTEARPIRAIPVPEEFVPLPKREWNANRKYWAAAAPCHLPLYFQDAALERYGYSVEQHVGPLGRYLTYPIDKPRQSKQRNQLLQPVFSVGLFAFQIGVLPWNLIMDPPWESEYDLGYFRPGDRVPTDVFYLPLFGVGPPLQGNNYGHSTARPVDTSSPRW
jgi:hypothetical protein